LGAVQGVAEVLPVSSSASLTLVPWLLGWDPPAHRTALAAGLHAGSCAGVASAVRPAPADLPRLLATSLPAAAAGLVAADAVEARLGRPAQLAPLLAAAGLLLWRADRSPVATGTPRRAGTAAALAQAAALVPGVSRAGATVTVLRHQGLPPGPALRESLPVTAGAAGLSLWRARGDARALAAPLAVGVPVAAAVSAFTARAALARPRAALRVAVAYRLGLAAVVAGRLLRERRGGAKGAG
jgi:undecaprenyl-diphosphatase